MELKFETEKKENAEVLLTLTIAKSELQAEYKKMIGEAQKNIVINGFRKGKVPLSIIEMKFKKGMVAEAAHKLIDEAYKQIFPDLKYKPIATSVPSLEEVGEIDLEKDFLIKIMYETFPDIKIGGYKNIEIEKEEFTVNEDDVEEEVAKYLAEFSTIESKETEIEEKDIVLVEYQVFENGKEIENKDNEYVHIGKEYDKYKLSSDIKGLKVGMEKEFTKKFNSDVAEELKGRTVTIKLKIKDVKFEKRPELTDELAKQIDKNIEGADAFVKKVRENLETYAADLTKEKAIDKIIKVILTTFEGNIPNSMVEGQLDSFYKEVLQRAGGDEKKALNLLKLEGHTKESYRDAMREKAVTLIKRSLILNDIVEKEKILAEEEDIKKYISKFAKFYNIKAEDLFENYKKNNQLEIFENDVKIEKAMDLLFQSAKIKKTIKTAIKDIKE